MSARIFQLLIFLRDAGRKLFFLATALLPPYRPTHGVTVVANLRDGASLSKAMRDFVIALKAVGIPYQTFDLCLCKNVSLADTAGALTPWWEFRARRFDHVVEMFRSPFPKFAGLTYAPIVFWEHESGFPESHPDIANCRDVIAMSDFNAEYFRKVLSARVHKVIYPFRLPSAIVPPREDVRRRFGIGADDFAVFFNFDLSSGVGRKNPDGAIRAFAAAFPAERNVRLVFKTMHARQHPDIVEELERLAADLGIADRFMMIADYLPHQTLYGLTAACDCYLSLHRGEGFGLGMAEAMALGVPVVATDYSSNTEFCTSENSVQVPYRIVPVPGRFRTGLMSAVTQWAEPDLDAAAVALRKLHANPDLRHQLGKSARHFIAEHFSLDNFRESVDSILSGPSPTDGCCQRSTGASLAQDAPRRPTEKR